MKVDIRVFRLYDADLLSMYEAGYSLKYLVQDTVSALANGRPINIVTAGRDTPLDKETNKYRFIAIFDDNDTKTIELLSNVIPRMRAQFCKQVLRYSLQKQNLMCFFSDTEEITFLTEAPVAGRVSIADYHMSKKAAETGRKKKPAVHGSGLKRKTGIRVTIPEAVIPAEQGTAAANRPYSPKPSKSGLTDEAIRKPPVVDEPYNEEAAIEAEKEAERRFYGDDKADNEDEDIRDDVSEAVDNTDIKQASAGSLEYAALKQTGSGSVDNSHDSTDGRSDIADIADTGTGAEIVTISESADAHTLEDKNLGSQISEDDTAERIIPENSAPSASNITAAPPLQKPQPIRQDVPDNISESEGTDEGVVYIDEDDQVLPASQSDTGDAGNDSFSEDDLLKAFENM